LFDPAAHSKLVELYDLMNERRAAHGTVVFAGNGGSSAIASHCAIDFSKNAGLRSINFADASFITCLANDYGYERWLEKALEFHSGPSDLIILISSSGKSPNVIRAADFALSRGNTLVTFTGFEENNPLRSRGKLNLWVDSRAYNIVEMTHHIWLLAVCDLLIGKAEYPAS
jgi:D-sedoheptulose 7-phosphate isomerase